MNQVTEKRISPRKSAVKTPAAKPVERKPRIAVSAKAKSTNPLAIAAGVVQKFFVFCEGARPVSGPRLAAHTNAALLFLGLAEKRAAKKNAVLAVLGTRAVKYHRDIGNLEEKADTLQLTTRGYNFFKSRIEAGKVDGNLNEAFLAALRKGKTNDAAEIKPADIYPVAMPIR